MVSGSIIIHHRFVLVDNTTAEEDCGARIVPSYKRDEFAAQSRQDDHAFAATYIHVRVCMNPAKLAVFPGLSGQMGRSGGYDFYSE